MTEQRTSADLDFPHRTAPDFGEVQEIADGVLWSKIPLPYQLDHVNIYLVRDKGGWAVIDTGIRTDAALAAWHHLFDTALAGVTISKVSGLTARIVSSFQSFTSRTNSPRDG